MSWSTHTSAVGAEGVGAPVYRPHIGAVLPLLCYKPSTGLGKTDKLRVFPGKSRSHRINTYENSAYLSPPNLI
jgi:hypothetical protein